MRMPAEWEAHEATWLAWPHERSDWPDVFPKIKNVYFQTIEILAQNEKVELICASSQIELEARAFLAKLPPSLNSNINFHIIENDRSWLRDSAPTSVINSENQISWVRWAFNAWAKYDNFSKDAELAKHVIEASKLPSLNACKREDELTVLEGGAIDSDGRGTLLVTEECLLSSTQARNPDLSKEDYEIIFKKYLGIKKCIWLGRGIAGDDTHGHIDGICRFVSESKVVLCEPRDGDQEYIRVYEDNVGRLEKNVDALGRKIEVINIPLPKNRFHGEQVLPASYANFYIANKVVLVPTFNDPNDKKVLGIFSELFPERKVLGVDSSDLIVGMGALHCITQPQFSDESLKNLSL